jgi:hypothetical protein
MRREFREADAGSRTRSIAVALEAVLFENGRGIAGRSRCVRAAQELHETGENSETGAKPKDWLHRITSLRRRTETE